ncbi:hypothetical protein ACJX0J_009426, partial [Zea mays]
IDIAIVGLRAPYVIIGKGFASTGLFGRFSRMAGFLPIRGTGFPEVWMEKGIKQRQGRWMEEMIDRSLLDFLSQRSSSKPPFVKNKPQQEILKLNFHERKENAWEDSSSDDISGVIARFDGADLQSSQCHNCEILKSMIIYVSSGEREGVPQGSGTSLDAVAAAIQILE